MSFDDIVSGMDATLFQTFGQRGILNGRLLVQVIVESQNSERFKNYEMDLNELQTIFSIRRGVAGTLRIGDVVETDQGRFVVDQIIQADQFIADVIVRAES